MRRIVLPLLLLSVLQCPLARGDEPPPEISLTLGAQNQGQGLKIVGDSDGANVPVQIAGQEARRVQGKGAGYLYVSIDSPAYHPGPRDLYVTVEAADDVFARVTLQYDKAAPTLSLATKYTAADQSFFLVGGGGWRTGAFFLPAVRMGHGQNFGADFRLVAEGVAFRKITISTVRPPGFDPGQKVDPASLAALTVKRQPGLEYTFGNDATPADASVYKALSVTSVESYVTWTSVEPKQNQWDWSKWDQQVATLKGAGLKWVPFLIAGPAYATPLWFHSSPHSHYFRCLEHGAESKVQSIFNPDLPHYVERFLAAFADHYRASGMIESVLLGVTGIYGESIYPAGKEGGWTAQLTGKYHNHNAWWAGDPYAVAAFRSAMEKKYGPIAALNQAWAVKYAGYPDVGTFLPERAPNDQARADFVEWYQRSMTEWAAFWVKTARKLLPQTEIYLCTGGDGNPQLGADFTAQAKAVAPSQAGIRITNEGSDYTHNFVLTREVATATRHYGSFCGFEPASHVDEKGIAARIYNATSSGARQLHDYSPNMMTNPAAIRTFRENAVWLTPRTPKVETALYLPRESWAFDAGRPMAALYEFSRQLRDLVDHDFVTRQSVEDGALADHRALILSEAPVLEPAAAAAIEKWVRAGGVLIAASRGSETIGGRLHDDAAWRERLLQTGAQRAHLLERELIGEAPAHWRLEIGRPGDEDWLFGQWHSRERGREWRDVPNAAKRWMAASAGIYLPVKPGTAHRLRLQCVVPPAALAKGPVQVALNGHSIGEIKAAGLQQLTFDLPADAVGSSPTAKLDLSAGAWKPSDHGAADTRTLSIGVHEVEVFQIDAEKTPPTPATLRLFLNREALGKLTRRLDQGWTITLPGINEASGSLLEVLTPLLSDTPRYLEGVAPLAAQDGKINGRYETTFRGSEPLWYDVKEAKIWSEAAAKPQ